MSAILYRRDKVRLDACSFIEIVIWEVMPPVPGSLHGYKYSMAYVVDGVCVLRYDNERGKGDHKHIGATEIKTRFTTIDTLVNAFFDDVETYRR
ncbi:hypothetical protein BKN67_22720 [Salmonella enterica]|uniref:toxin-antitoxin system TumE family protein n=1 Tax=Salmonella enterica TaxID=28901 RepID=UPI0009E7EE1B|nr:DUF6516 family protein [Salmonella enterica]EBQ5244402.1 hypothetical protein [Salmonella enterica subsp. salamae]ECY7604138.1 hypothetical protein [Salmonella enterica subsp. enterica serovar Muenchen]EDH3763724.1 hypothetical protein [Salmonella enterica subsp. enterica]EEE1922920.1 hypothetical protein [Salmonella enterica subsp. diarizonae]EAX8243431.1 hypothetical protein [Salmonella enterica]